MAFLLCVKKKNSVWELQGGEGLESAQTIWIKANFSILIIYSRKCLLILLLIAFVLEEVLVVDDLITHIYSRL